MRDSPPSERGRRLAWWLLASGVAAYMVLSAQGLLAIGIPYDPPYGPFIAKLHPGSWLITLAYLVLISSHGHPMRVAASQLGSQPLLLAYLVCMGFIFVYSILRHGPSGAAFIIDTLVMPAICALALLMIDGERRYACLVMVIGLLVVNALLGMGETLLQMRLIPMRVAGEPEIPEEFFRPSSLLGHPLANALITATLLPAVLHLRIAMAWRCALMIVLWVGLLSFGGRTSFVLATVGFGCYFAVAIASAALHGRFSYKQVTGGAFVGMMSAALVGIAIAVSGIGERIFKSLVWDSSAAVRQRIWRVFDYLSAQDILVGVSPADISDLVWRLDLHSPGESIENFWLVILLQLGIIGFVPFAIGMACATLWLWQSSRGPMRLTILLFFAAASSNNSLASKSVSLSMLFIAVAVTRRRNRSRPGPIEERADPVQTAALATASRAGPVGTFR